MKHLPAHLPRKIRFLRKEFGYTQESFAEKADIDYKYYQKIETGKTGDIKLSMLDKIADTLGLSIWELLHPETHLPPGASYEQLKASDPSIAAEDSP